MRLQKKIIFLLTNLFTYILLAIYIPYYLGIETNSYGISIFDDLKLHSIFLILISFITLITWAFLTKSKLNYILLLSVIFSFTFVTFTTSRFQVLELSDQHAGRNVTASGSDSGAINYNFKDLNPANNDYEANYIPPFTIIHSKIGESYNKQLEDQPAWLLSNVSGYPLLWFLNPVGASLKASINFQHYIMNIIIYFIIFLIPNLTNLKLHKKIHITNNSE